MMNAYDNRQSVHARRGNQGIEENNDVSFPAWKRSFEALAQDDSRHQVSCITSSGAGKFPVQSGMSV